jgi:hypothetical protein
LNITDPDTDDLHIWLRNKFSVPHDADFHQVVQRMSQIASTSADDFLTDALIINPRPELRPGELDAIRIGNLGAIGPASLRNPGFRLLNEVIGAHQMVRIGPYVSGMGTLWPRMLTEREIFERIAVEVVFIVDSDCSIDKDLVLRLFEDIDRERFGLPAGALGDLRDYSDEQILTLGQAIRKLRSHAFYELKTNAIAAMLRGDSIVAVVLGCAALEGAHGAFVRLALRAKLTEGSAKFNKFMDGLLREQGFFTLVQLSVRVLMADEERPTEEELEKCLRGVTIRNAIMHAGIKGTGKYKMREITESKINEGYRGLMAVYRAFESAVESREKL